MFPISSLSRILLPNRIRVGILDKDDVLFNDLKYTLSNFSENIKVDLYKFPEEYKAFNKKCEEYDIILINPYIKNGDAKTIVQCLFMRCIRAKIIMITNQEDNREMKHVYSKSEIINNPEKIFKDTGDHVDFAVEASILAREG